MQVNDGLTNTNVTALAVSGTSLFAGTVAGVFLSTDNGTHWSSANNGLTNSLVMSFAICNTLLFVGTNGGGVFLSSNSGVSWTSVNSGLTNLHVFSLATSDTNLFAGTSDGGVFLSTNRGTSWAGVETGLIKSVVEALAVSGTDLCAGTSGAGVWRRPLSEVITWADPASNPEPSDFSLHQNYPNPFNPTTSIEYALPHAGYVSLRVYNVLGEGVATLVDGQQAAGTLKTTWDASHMPSGVYFYRLTAGEYVQTRKMVLMR